MKKLVLLALLWASPAWAQNFGSNFSVTATPTVSVGAHTVGQSLGGLITMSVFRPNNPAGIISFIAYASKAGQTTAATVYIFDTKPSASTTCTDGQTFSLAAADMSKVAFNPVAITPAVPQSGTMAMGQSVVVQSARNGDNPFTQNLYACVVANGTITTGSASDTILTIGLRQN